MFDDDATRVMGETFDSAVQDVEDKFHPRVTYEIIARRIIIAAWKGDRDQRRLRDAAIRAINRLVDNGNQAASVGGLFISATST